MKFNYIHILLCFILVFQPVNFSQISVPGYDEFIPPPQLDPTNANIATPENVLIVYRLPRSQGDTMSFHIANYYKQVRNIPETNIIGLNLPLIKEINGHTIKMLFYDELIHDDDWIAPPNTTNHAWQYVQNFIMTPLQNHLDVTFVQGQPLRDLIRYIVICKGVPFKVNPYVEFSGVGQTKNIKLP